MEESFRLRDDLPRCPVCGSKAFTAHDVLIEYGDFGYSAGCPNFAYDDGIHGITVGDEEHRFSRCGFYTLTGAEQWWRNRVDLFDAYGKWLSGL